MRLPLQITFRQIDTSPSVEAKIRERAQELDRYCDQIIACRIMVECQHRRHRRGKLFHIRVDMTVPGQELVAKRDPPARHEHEDVYVAIRDAFDAARRQLEDWARAKRQYLKLHAIPDRGRVLRLLQDGGFIVTVAGEEIYFHRNSVAAAGFDRLVIGNEVRFVTEYANSANGPQASTVVILGKSSRASD